MEFISVFLDIAKFADSRKKMLMSAEPKGYVMWFVQFLEILQVRYNCAKFHYCRICVRDFREGGLFDPHPSVSSSQKAILNRVKVDSLSLKSLLRILYKRKRKGYCKRGNLLQVQKQRISLDEHFLKMFIRTYSLIINKINRSLWTLESKSEYTVFIGIICYLFQ